MLHCIRKKVSQSVSPEKGRTIYLGFAPSQYKLLWYLFPFGAAVVLNRNFIHPLWKERLQIDNLQVKSSQSVKIHYKNNLHTSQQ